jgi:hypothetical protein
MMKSPDTELDAARNVEALASRTLKTLGKSWKKKLRMISVETRTLKIPILYYGT